MDTFRFSDNLNVPPEAYEILREVILLGASKGHDKWWEESVDVHLDHARRHLVCTDSQVSHHLNHAFTRLMMAAVIQHRRNSK